jgi:hypothetical protein
MLRHAGAGSLADQVDRAVVAAALPGIATMAREAGSPASIG